MNNSNNHCRLNDISTNTPLTILTRTENDNMGEIEVPVDCYYGSQTARAIKNFPISGNHISAMPELIRALAWVKKAAALTNGKCELICQNIVEAICSTCDEIINGKLHNEFCVDVIQGGAGTSTNMNANEVIANRALELLGFQRGEYQFVHPNDHVNRSQSTNDSYATAVRLTVYQLCETLGVAVMNVVRAFKDKSNKFDQIRKLGRTQLQAAVPMTVGQEFEAFAETLSEDLNRLSEIKKLFLEVNLGGTAIGTGIGANLNYQELIVKSLADVSGIDVCNAANRIEATWDMGAFTLFSGLIKRLAVKLSKISNDLRLLSSGPSGGFGEINLPDKQPGSSLMPGKVNPVIPEVVNQVCFKIFGADTTVTFAAEAGQLQLKAMEPLILTTIYESCMLLVAAMDTLTTNCIKGITVNEKQCLKHLEASTALATLLVPEIGYQRACDIAKEALKSESTFMIYLEREHPELIQHIKI